jgi:hypothetical protein
MRMRDYCWFGFLALVLASSMPAAASGRPIEPGQFLGLFTYTQVRKPLARQVGEIERVLGSNPYLKGLTIRVAWGEEEPEQGQFDWSAVDRMIAVAHARHLYITLDPIAGTLTPGWVYGAGVKRFDSTDINPHHQTYGQTLSMPVPWDSAYHRLWQNFISQLAARYGNDPSLLEVSIFGHNTNMEMHMPHRPEDIERWRQLGWSPELVERDWKSWIDFFAQTFPRTHIGLVLSPMYGESTNRVVEELAAYAVSRYANQLIFMTHVLDGRRDQEPVLQIHICLEYPQVLNAQETVSSFQTDPSRQGNLQMFVYNMRQLSPLFVRLWRADAVDANLCSRIIAEYQHAQSMSVAAYKSELQSKGLYTTVDTYQASQKQGRGQGGAGSFFRRRGFLPY